MERTRVHLRQIAIPTPCKVDWNAMRGEGAIRFCASCKQDVYNLSEMTEDEAEALLAKDEAICVRFYHRPDGTIVTSACPTAPRRRSLLAAGMAGALAYTTAFAGISAVVDEPAVAADDDAPALVAMGGGVRISTVLTPEEQERMNRRRHDRAERRRLDAAERERAERERLDADRRRDLDETATDAWPDLTAALEPAPRAPRPSPWWPISAWLLLLLAAGASRVASPAVVDE